MQRNNEISNKVYQDYFIDLDKFILRKNIFPNNRKKIFFITLMFKKDVDSATLMTYN
ncbi:MAG: hypothetical protein Q8K37_06565 [Alphaproteobacteria bacterium]|nr:hypothetical protein [Alphaproteobacteria bacterium]